MCRYAQPRQYAKQCKAGWHVPQVQVSIAVAEARNPWANSLAPHSLEPAGITRCRPAYYPIGITFQAGRTAFC